MKICHVTCAHPRYDVRILEKECQSLAKSGYIVYLIVNDDKPDETKYNVNIVSTGFKPGNRAERLLLSASKTLKKAMEVDADVYHLHDPELLKIVDPLLKKKKKVIFDAHEDTEEQIKDKKWIPVLLRSPVAFLYGIYAHNKMRRLNGVVTVTPKFVEKFSKYNSNTALVTNYPIISEEASDQAEYEINTDFKYIFFAGGISKQWCHEEIADAVSKIEGLKYIIAGRGDKEYIDKICQKGACYLGVLPHAKIKDYYNNAIAGMAVLECTQVGNEGTLGNTKLFEVMEAGKPVICSDLKLWRAIIDECACGICVEDDIRSIFEAIKFFMNNPNIAEKMGKNGKKAVAEKYNWKQQEKNLLEFYRQI